MAKWGGKKGKDEGRYSFGREGINQAYIRLVRGNMLRTVQKGFRTKSTSKLTLKRSDIPHQNTEFGPLLPALDGPRLSNVRAPADAGVRNSELTRLAQPIAALELPDRRGAVRTQDRVSPLLLPHCSRRFIGWEKL